MREEKSEYKRYKICFDIKEIDLISGFHLKIEVYIEIKGSHKMF